MVQRSAIEAEGRHGAGRRILTDLAWAQGQVGVDARVREERERVEARRGRDDRGHEGQHIQAEVAAERRRADPLRGPKTAISGC
jgi:hypothetical protein